MDIHSYWEELIAEALPVCFQKHNFVTVFELASSFLCFSAAPTTKTLKHDTKNNRSPRVVCFRKICRTGEQSRRRFNVHFVILDSESATNLSLSHTHNYNSTARRARNNPTRS